MIHVVIVFANFIIYLTGLRNENILALARMPRMYSPLLPQVPVLIKMG